jgi:hypothetical protein
VAGLAQYSLESGPIDFIGISCRFSDIDPDPLGLSSLEQYRSPTGNGAAFAAFSVVDLDQGIADATLFRAQLNTVPFVSVLLRRARGF